jgi:2-dehydro-3-deoxyphosphooctonate aldolase (KDO 8-P synthase)
MIESEALCLDIARHLKRTCQRLGIPYVFKASFDKANRTSGNSPRGPGLEAGLAVLEKIRSQLGLPVVTDIHNEAQAAIAGEIVDVLQIPAFLCRQTDLLAAAAATGRVVNVKKGQFLSPMEMKHVVAKLTAGGAAEIWQTERGTTFGYQNLVVDMRSFGLMKANGFPAVFDATHSVQLPGGGGDRSSGQREFVPPLACAALAAGADGLFIETHPDPANAISDGPNQIPLGELAALLDRCLAIWRAAR